MTHPQNPQKEGLILLTVAFLERGDVLKNGSTGVQKYEMDLFVPDSITCDQLMGAIYVGIRDTLISRFHLDLSRRITDLAYRSTACEIPEQENRRELRRDIIQGIQMRAYTAQNNRRLRKIAELDRKFGMPKLRTEISSQEMEKMSWVVCWQVFHECFHSYCKGYPKDLRYVKMRYDRLAVIARSTPTVSGEGNGTAGKPLLWLNKASYGSQTLRRLGFVWGTKLVFDPVLMSKDAALDCDKIFSVFRNGKIQEANTSDILPTADSGDILSVPLPARIIATTVCCHCC